jgi:hypothetical protein
MHVPGWKAKFFSPGGGNIQWHCQYLESIQSEARSSEPQERDLLHRPHVHFLFFRSVQFEREEDVVDILLSHSQIHEHPLPFMVSLQKWI